MDLDSALLQRSEQTKFLNKAFLSGDDSLLEKAKFKYERTSLRGHRHICHQIENLKSNLIKNGFLTTGIAQT